MKNCAVFILLFGLSLYMGAQTKSTSFKNIKSNSGFVENKGQVINQNNNPNPSIKFLLSLPYNNILLKTSGFSYDTYTIEEKEQNSQLPNEKFKEPQKEIIYKFHRIDVDFIGANPFPEIVKKGESEDYRNYYTTGTGEIGVTNVHHYDVITYQNIYPKIDIEFIARQGKEKPVEYNFILHPGADINQIQLRYTGALKSKLVNNKIRLKLSHGNLTENIPSSYWQSANRKENIHYKLISTNNKQIIVGFEGKFDKVNETLIIDPNPNLDWGTYYGGGGDDNGRGIATDVFGNVLITGFTNSASNIATSGAYQTAFAGTNDVYAAKFNKIGAIKWSTYFGGSASEWGKAICADKNGNVIVTGFTESSSNIATLGSHQATFGGGTYDAFIVKFDSIGSRLWSTYYGGSSDDDGTGIKTDNQGNIFICGSTGSLDSIVTAGAYQTTYRNGDAFLSKFDANGVIQWGTYYGGNSNESGSGVSVDPNGNVFLLGLTTSASLIATNGSYQTTFGGLPFKDAFIAKFTSIGNLLWATYYGGNKDDYGLAIANDDQGNVLVTGYTDSPTSIATIGAYQTSYAGNDDAFIAKFDSSGNIKWATYYGGVSIDHGYGISSDSSNDVLITGYSHSTAGIATSNAYQTINRGLSDIIVLKFDSGGSLQWASYYGGTGYDNGWSAAADISGNLYITGSTASSSYISTAGVYHPSYGGGPNDSFVARFSTCVAPPAPTNTTPIANQNICTNTSTILMATSIGIVNWFSTPSSTTAISSGSTYTTPTLTTGITPTTYTYFAEAITCTVSVTRTPITVTVNPLPIVNVSTNDTLICVGQTTTLTATGAATYTWNTTATGSPIAVSPTVTTNYTVTGTDANGCTNLAVITQSVSACVNIQSFTQTQLFNLYPNPNNGEFTLELNSNSQVIIYDALGEVIFNENYKNGKYLFDFTNKKSCLYFLRVISDSKQQTYKIIKQ